MRQCAQWHLGALLATAVLHTYIKVSHYVPGQVWNDKDEQDECLAMVVRTGLNTTVGKMMRPLVHNHWAASGKQLRTPMGFHCEV